MAKMKYTLIAMVCLTFLSGCDNFEKRFYQKIDEGQIRAIENGSDVFDLSTITDFDWDSVLLIRGNESVPVFKEEIEEVLNNKFNTIDREKYGFSKKTDTIFRWHTKDLGLNRDRFYFLTSDKKIIEKEIARKREPAFEIRYCQENSGRRYWLSKEDCKFTLTSNTEEVGKGTVWLKVKCTDNESQ